MAPPGRPRRQQLTREDLPAELTPESLRGIDFHTLRSLARHGNGVLDAAEQQQFDAAFAEVMRGTASAFNQSLERTRGVGPANLDPAMRRSYQRTQQRLAEQARRARESYPELAIDHPPETTPDEPPATEPPATEPPATESPVPEPDAGEEPDDTSPDSLQEELEQTSDTLDMLEKIASLQQQQVEHQATQLLTETRGLFFAFLVSVAVIIAGVAPLVEADPHDRWLTIVWTAVCVAVAGAVYVVVRLVQGRRR